MSIPTWLIGKMFECDVVRNLERESEMRGHLLAEFLQPFFCGKLIVASVHADRRKSLSVFTQALPLELGFGKFTASQIFLFIVNLSAPAGIFEVDPVLRPEMIEIKLWRKSV